MTDSGGERGARDGSTAADDEAGGQERGARDVVVPMGVYKTVTVFSTLIAIGAVVGGFLLLDAATDRSRAPAADVDPLLAVGGVGLMALGAAVYAFSTRFRAPGMGKPKDDPDEPPGDG